MISNEGCSKILAFDLDGLPHSFFPTILSFSSSPNPISLSIPTPTVDNFRNVFLQLHPLTCKSISTCTHPTASHQCRTTCLYWFKTKFCPWALISFPSVSTQLLPYRLSPLSFLHLQPPTLISSISQSTKLALLTCSVNLLCHH